MEKYRIKELIAMNKSIEQEGKNQKYDSINWKQFYISVTALVIPMALQNLINVGVTAADVAMLGRVGEKVLSGASLAGQIQFVMTLILFGITSGITVLTAQYWGKRDNQAIEKILGMGMVFGVAVAIIFTIIGYFFPEQAMRIFTSDPEVIEEAVKYLRIVCFSYVLIAITQVYLYVMRSIERVVIATVVYSISLGVNIGVNAVLIFGLFGFPKLGIQGAAIGTLVARVLEVTIVMFYAFFKNKIVQIRMRYMIRFDKLLVSDYVRYAMPVIVNEMIWGLGFSMHSVVIGNLGSAAVAANAVTQVLRQFSMVVVFGISNATAIYLGKTIGEGKIEETKRYAKRFLVISIIAGLLGGCVILITGPIARDVMTLGEESKEYLDFMTKVMAVYVACMSVSCTTIVGILRSGGDTKFSLIVDTVIMWGFSIPLGALAAFVFNWGVPIVYVFLLTDELLKLPVALKRFYSYKWLNNVTRNHK